MNVSRRGFLSSILALAAAPAIVRADSLMRIAPMETCVLMGFDPADFARVVNDPRPVLDYEKIAALLSGYYGIPRTLKILQPNTYTIRRPA